MLIFSTVLSLMPSPVSIREQVRLFAESINNHTILLGLSMLN